jgi:hypothetical protein
MRQKGIRGRSKVRGSSPIVVAIEKQTMKGRGIKGYGIAAGNPGCPFSLLPLRSSLAVSCASMWFPRRQSSPMRSGLRSSMSSIMSRLSREWVRTRRSICPSSIFCFPTLRRGSTAPIMAVGEASVSVSPGMGITDSIEGATTSGCPSDSAGPPHGRRSPTLNLSAGCDRRERADG